MSPQLKRKIVGETIKWCMENLGVNNRRKYGLSFSVHKTKNDWYGSYDCFLSHIHVYHNNCKNVRDLVSTTIHEYTHHLQPIRTKYFKLMGEYSYSQHPHEVEAVFNEHLFTPKCWKEIKGLI